MREFGGVEYAQLLGRAIAECERMYEAEQQFNDDQRDALTAYRKYFWRILLEGFRSPNDTTTTTNGNLLWATCIDEEYRANLLDLRAQWYGDRPLNWRIHLRVKLLTLKFLIIDLGWFRLSYWLQQLLNPMRKPRL